MTCNWRSRIAISVLEGFKRKYDAGSFTDTEIDIQGTIFRCHKVFLSAISDYFHAMFSSGMRESLDGKVTLEGITIETFRDILDFYYDSQGNIVCTDNVEEILRAATLLQMGCLQERCEEFYVDQLSVENAIGIWQLAKCLNCESLKKKAMDFVLEYFVEVGNQEEIIGLECPDLLEVLSNDDLKVPSEDMVCDIALRWVQHDWKRRKCFLRDLCKTVRTSLLSDVCLHKLLTLADRAEGSADGENNLTIVDEDICNKEMHTYVDLKQSQKPRNYEEVLVTIGVRVSAGLLPSVNAYSFLEGKWFALEQLPLDPGAGFAVCAYNNHIYISGRHGRKTYLLDYDSSVDQWLHCPEMPDNRCYHEMVASNDSLYVIGGCNKREGALASVYVYNILERKWHHFSHLLFGVYSTSCAVIGNTLFVFGGRGMGSRRTQEVQAMNLTNGTATIVHLFPTPITESRALSDGDEAFVCTTNGSVMKIFEDGAVFNVAKMPNFDRYNFGVFLHRGLLVVTGGDTRYPSGLGAFDDMIQVIIDDKEKLSKETVVMRDKLYPFASAFGCQKIILHRSFLRRPALPEHQADDAGEEDKC
ncbi:kelch-like protein 24 [Haliotis cracherodii]|uniref:kelch-like protein 24 n=1 Tax=Haliotis cracherodii TaxID=6455 RepID=UPI0039E91295